jgi:hypothetical protein
MTQLRISFTAGENQGESYSLLPEQVVSVGRSHSNTIRLSAPDVSAKHLIIRMDKGGNASVEVLSSRTTVINGKNASIGDMLKLLPGSMVQMGSNTSFIIESEGGGDMKTIIPSDDNEKTALPTPGWNNDSDSEKTTMRSSADTPTAGKAVPPPADNKTIGKSIVNTILQFGNKREPENVSSEETIAFQTRVASDDEMDKIKKSIRSKQRKKVILIALPLFLFFSVAVFLYFYLKPSAEEFVTWPTDSSGKFLNGYRQIAPYLALAYPNVPGCALTGDDSGVEINTRIGKLRDVRLHILGKTVKDPATLEQDHQDAFEKWMDALQEQEVTLTFGGDRTTTFLNTSKGAGVPMTSISYTRRVGNDDFWGYLFFLRNEDNISTVMIEVELGDQWRAEPFMHVQTPGMIIYAYQKTEEHWEGTSSYRRETTVAEDIKEAFNFMERKAPVYWGRIYYLLRSALIKSAKSETPDQEQITDALNMLVRLRRLQTTWYNTQRLAWQYAFRNEDKSTMNSIQAMGESVFSSEFQYSDFRYDLIKRKDWK